MSQKSSAARPASREATYEIQNSEGGIGGAIAQEEVAAAKGARDRTQQQKNAAAGSGTPGGRMIHVPGVVVLAEQLIIKDFSRRWQFQPSSHAEISPGPRQLACRGV